MKLLCLSMLTVCFLRIEIYGQSTILQIQGRLISETGAPINAQVSVFKKGKSVSLQTTNTRNGRFSFQLLRQKQYRLEAYSREITGGEASLQLDEKALTESKIINWTVEAASVSAVVTVVLQTEKGNVPYTRETEQDGFDLRFLECAQYLMEDGQRSKYSTLITSPIKDNTACFYGLEPADYVILGVKAEKLDGNRTKKNYVVVSPKAAFNMRLIGKGVSPRGLIRARR